MILMLLISSVTDLLYHRIPNALLVPALAAALLLGALHNGMGGLGLSLAGLCVGLFMLMPLYVAGGTSAGDVKLLGVAGAFLGPLGALFAGMFTFIAGAVLGLLWIASNMARTTARHHLAGSEVIRGRTIMDARAEGAAQQKSAFAYAPAILVGAVCAAWYQGLMVVGG